MEASPVPLAYSVEHGFTRSHAPAIDEWKAYAAARFPEEACGFLMLDGTFLPVPNVHQDPLRFFMVHEDDQIAAREHGPILALLHSHTDGPEIDDRTGRIREASVSPSSDDMHYQQESGIAWGISRVCEGGTHDPVWFGDELGRAPLYGRVFIHGIWDCMALIRDWHAEQGITSIPNQPRDEGWWDRGLNLYEENLERGGFVRVQPVARPSGPLPGDVFLCRLPQKVEVLNHGGIFLGDNTLIHHKPGRLSGPDHAHLWQSKLDYLVRHKDLPEDWRP